MPSRWHHTDIVCSPTRTSSESKDSQNCKTRPQQRQPGTTKITHDEYRKCIQHRDCGAPSRKLPVCSSPHSLAASVIYVVIPSSIQIEGQYARYVRRSGCGDAAPAGDAYPYEQPRISEAHRTCPTKTWRRGRVVVWYMHVEETTCSRVKV
jgi:hypothetical protein